MKLQSYFATLGMVALSVVTVGGCTVTTSSGDAGDNTDAGTGTGQDTGTTTTDTGTAVDSGTTMDSGTTPRADASDSAAACSVAPSTTSAACDQCVESMCCPQLEACFGTGTSAAPCVELTSCMQDCEAGKADEGIPRRSQSDCLANFCAGDGGIYTAADQSKALALLACLGDGDAGANRCGTACGN